MAEKILATGAPAAGGTAPAAGRRGLPGPASRGRRAVATTAPEGRSGSAVRRVSACPPPPNSSGLLGMNLHVGSRRRAGRRGDGRVFHQTGVRAVPGKACVRAPKCYFLYNMCLFFKILTGIGCLVGFLVSSGGFGLVSSGGFGLVLLSGTSTPCRILACLPSPFH